MILNMNKSSTILKRAAVLAGLALGSFAIAALADWTAPNNTPPACPTGQPGCDAPVNVGASAQTKTGSLAINASELINGIDPNTNTPVTTALAILNGAVGIGTTSPSGALAVAGGPIVAAGGLQLYSQTDTTGKILGAVDGKGTIGWQTSTGITPTRDFSTTNIGLFVAGTTGSLSSNECVYSDQGGSGGTILIGPNYYYAGMRNVQNGYGTFSEVIACPFNPNQYTHYSIPTYTSALTKDSQILSLCNQNLGSTPNVSYAIAQNNTANGNYGVMCVY